jgi:SPP1 gp7 family putative phage head morphogenesis protein
MSVSKREATALVRTSVMQVANATRQETYKANADVLDGFEFIATLDARTCPRCAVYDGKQYDMNMQPIGHDLPFPGVPVHWNCRCTLAPSTKSWAELAGLDSPLSKDQITELDAVPVGDRVSMNGLIVGDTNYSDWLSSQDEATQQEILGPNRYQLWVENKLDMSDLVNNNGMPLTIKALQVKLGVSIPVYDEVEVKAATKLYSEGLIDGRKTSYMSNAIIKNESTEEASIMVGATEDHLKSAKVLLDGIRKAEVSEESLHRSLVFGDQINEKTKVLKMALDNIKVGETISMDRISSFSSDPSWAAYYGVAGKHKEILNYKLEIIGPHKAFQTDVYTGLSHKESVTEGLFEVVEIKGKSVSNIAYPYNGQVRYSKTIVLRQKEVF